MATYTFDMGERKLIDQITDPDVLTSRVPRLKEFYEGMKEKREAVRHGGFVGAHTKMTGFTEGGNWQFVGTLPVSVFSAILEIDPAFGTDVKKTVDFFQRHPEVAIAERMK